MSISCINEYNEDVPFIRVSLNDGTVIAQGRALFQKVRYSILKDGELEVKSFEHPLLSIDNKFFFNPLSKKFTIAKIKNGEHIPFVQSHYTTQLDIKHWNTVKINSLSPDVYVDQDITECDPEIKELVFALNKLPFIETKGSCSGHGYQHIYIDIKFSRMNELIGMLKIIEKHFQNDFVLSSNPRIKQESTESVIMTLYSVDKGENAFKRVDKLAKYIEMIQ